MARSTIIVPCVRSWSGWAACSSPTATPKCCSTSSLAGERHGLRKLRGMYAFALWDVRNASCGLSAIPMGSSRFMLRKATELSGLLPRRVRWRGRRRSITGEMRRRLSGFYLWGHVPEPFTWWSGIRVLSGWSPAAGARRGEPAPRGRSPKWKRHICLDCPASGRRRVAQPLAMIQCAITWWPTSRSAFFLSAGIDSNIVAALAAEHKSRLQSVTLAFEEYAGTDMDEAPLGGRGCADLGATHDYRIGRSEFEELHGRFLRVHGPAHD